MEQKYVVATTYEELVKRYEDQKQSYGMTDHRYWSTGGYPFSVEQQYTDVNGFIRYALLCQKQTNVEFFAYGLKDEVGGFGLPPVTAALPTGFRASYAETNLLNKRQTNNEDFAIQGLSATSVGCRVQYPSVITATSTAFGVQAGAAATSPFNQVIGSGGAVITDPASTVVPPEVSSSLVLRDTLMEALRGKISFQIFWDGKASDILAMLTDVPEGGANSYLWAHGEPSTHNFFRLKDGWTWNKSDGKRDKDLAIYGRVEQDTWVTVTLPPLNQLTTAANIGNLQTLWLQIKIALHGTAFYWPSENI